MGKGLTRKAGLGPTLSAGTHPLTLSLRLDPDPPKGDPSERA